MGNKNNLENGYWESLFSFVYGIGEIIPSEFQEPTLQSNSTQEENDYLIKEDILLAEEKKEKDLILIESQKWIVQKSYNKSLR